MTDAVQKSDGRRKPSAIFAQRYREKARQQKQQFDQNLISLEKSNEYLKSKQHQLENAVAVMKNYVQYMKNKDSNPNESISTGQYVATDFIRSTRILDNNHVDNPAQFDFDYNIPCLLLDEETYIRSPVQPEAGDEDRIQLINSQSRTHDFEILDNLPMDLDENSQSIGMHQELVDLKNVDIDSAWGNTRSEDFKSEEQFDLEEIYNILPHLSLHQGELNNLEVMKIEEMLRSEVAKHGQPLPTNGLTISDKLNGDQSFNSPLDPKKGNFILADSSASNSPYSTSSTLGDQFEHDDIINYMLTDGNMEVNFDMF